MRAFSHNNIHGPLIWLGLCALGGGIVAASMIPRWQTPWYKRESGALDLRAELARRRPDGAGPGSNVVKRSVSIQTVGEDGVRHEYSSMEEVPPEIRSQIEALEREAAQAPGSELTVRETSQAGSALTSKIVRQKKVSVYKLIDEAGVERTYHSLEEMPPELRAAIAEAEDKPKT